MSCYACLLLRGVTYETSACSDALHDRAAAEALRESVVAPAKRSMSAMRKIRTGKTSEGLPVHCFRSLIADRETLSKNRIHNTKTGAMFDL